MKTIAIAVGSVLAALATSASAQFNYRSYADPYSVARGDVRDSNQECWNPRARGFESVRPGERQDDLDFSRCRLVDARRYDERRYDDRRYDDRRYYESRNSREARQECWNPRAGHFEALRPGEYQDDLDLRRCRMIEDRLSYRYR